ncbi:SAUR-like auxin-responsive protein family [Actinidia rufa]|uniref:SAUR-like auxin-responsive protein family n=1 Tax=Actinidia rufa TaxID=165716 RepID=A0A7J0GPD0_9ERIC|nr:SAUR-like auxin-responsive protein family [Actinidia rufa]
MKKLIRRLSRVADSSQYSPLRPELPARASSSRFDAFRSGKIGRSRVRSVAVPDGHIPVYVGEEMERFVVSAELLNHPMFVKLLNKSAQEYGYEQKGVLHIPCHVLVFERFLEALRVGDDSVQDLLNSLSDDFI